MTAPSWKWRPKFKSGDQSCTITTYNETRSRLTAGNTFFRSKDVGTTWNNISLQMVVSTLTLGGFVNPTPTSSTNWTGSWTASDTICELTVIHTPTNYIQYYYAEQGVADILNPPLCLTKAVTDLRSQINGDTSRIIEMPTEDVPAGWDASINEINVCTLTAFGPTNMSGAEAGPSDPDTVRTGPERAIVYINQSEDGIADGTPQSVQKLLQYDGANWVLFSGN